MRILADLQFELRLGSALPRTLRFYVLHQRMPVRVHDFCEWLEWMAANDPQVAVSYFGQARVSTVFLGVSKPDEPGIFETLIRGGSCDGFRERYPSWIEASQGHVAACAIARRAKGC